MVSRKKSHKAMGWRERIAKATTRGHFTNTDKSRAGSWRACAYADVFFRNKTTNNVPSTPVVQQIGLEFSNAVKSDNVGAARAILYVMEAAQKTPELRERELEVRF